MTACPADGLAVKLTEARLRRNNETLHTADAIGGSATQDVVPVARLRELSANWRARAAREDEDGVRYEDTGSALRLQSCAIELDAIVKFDAITTERSATADTRTDTEGTV